MFEQDAFRVEGVVIAVRSARTCRVRLENGHEFFGFLHARDSSGVRLAVGQKVWVRLSPYDLSEGRILTDRITI